MERAFRVAQLSVVFIKMILLKRPMRVTVILMKSQRVNVSVKVPKNVPLNGLLVHGLIALNLAVVVYEQEK